MKNHIKGRKEGVVLPFDDVVRSSGLPSGWVFNVIDSHVPGNVPRLDQTSESTSLSHDGRFGQSPNGRRPRCLHAALFPTLPITLTMGSGKEMVDRLSNLVVIFDKPELNFHVNRADGDDLLAR